MGFTWGVCGGDGSCLLLAVKCTHTDPHVCAAREKKEDDSLKD